jgi:hypothetical protein
MSSSNTGDTLQDLIRCILDSSVGGADKATMRGAYRHFSAIARLDYRTALRGHFDDWQIRELISELRRMLPDLNRKIFSETRIKHLAKKAAGLGVTLQAKPFDGARGRALRGFYLSGESRQGEPLLYVNTAGHPVAVAAAFWHEVGHHLGHRIFGGHQEAFNLSFEANYADHLTSPDELVADMVMTLGCYPRLAAQRIFGAKSIRGSGAEALVMSAHRYIRGTTSLDFDQTTPAQDNIHMLAGMIHLAKLRAVLLSEYGI